MLIQNKFKKKMNQIVRKLTVLVLISFSCFLLTRCTKMNHDVKFDIKSVEKKTEIHLTDDQDSPTCSFAQVYTYLDESSKDTLIQKINSNIKEDLFGPEYKLIPNEVLVDSFLAKYIVDYKADVLELYLEDKKNTSDENEYQPSWYSYEYDQNTSIKEGKKNILNYMSTIMEYRGGAHPNTWHIWLNVDKKTGNILKKQDVFISGSENIIIEMIKNELVKQYSEVFPDESFKTFDDIADHGSLLIDQSEMYIPENFLLKEDGVEFLYNQYEIFPYAHGPSFITLPYSDLSKYMLY